MLRKAYTAERTISKLGEAEVLLSRGATTISYGTY